MKNVLFIVLCIIVFVIFINIGKNVGMWKVTNDKYGDLKVKWNDQVGTMYKDLSYGDKDSNKYDLYLPADKSKKNYSLIFHIHGGGFNSGDKSEGEILMKYFASKGYVTASSNYSLMDDTHTSNLNVMYDELVKALNEVIKEANNKGYNITEMAVTGESAGGCLAMLLAFRYENSPIPIKFIFEESGPASFEPSMWADTDKEGQVSFINSMTGKSFKVEDMATEEYQNAINEISPVSYINENTIPMLLAYGANDKIVPPKIKEPLIEALDKYNVPHDYLLLPNSGHGLLGDKDKLLEYHKKMIEYANKYFENK